MYSIFNSNILTRTSSTESSNNNNSESKLSKKVVSLAHQLMEKAHSTSTKLVLTVFNGEQSFDSNNHIYTHTPFKKSYELFASPDDRTVRVYTGLKTNDPINPAAEKIISKSKRILIDFQSSPPKISPATTCLHIAPGRFSDPNAVSRYSEWLLTDIEKREYLKGMDGIRECYDQNFYMSTVQGSPAMRFSVYLPSSDINSLEYIAKIRSLDIPMTVRKIKLVALFHKILKGMADLHERGVVHMNLVPCNIFYDEKTFGFANFNYSVLSRETQQRFQGGTSAYYPPEYIDSLVLQNSDRSFLRSALEPSHDIWTAGCALYALYLNLTANPQLEMDGDVSLNWMPLMEGLASIDSVKRSIYQFLPEPTLSPKESSTSSTIESDEAQLIDSTESQIDLLFNTINEWVHSLSAIEPAQLAKSPLTPATGSDLEFQDRLDELDVSLDFYADELSFIINLLGSKLTCPDSDKSTKEKSREHLVNFEASLANLQEVLRNKIIDGITLFENEPKSNDPLLQLIHAMIRLDPSQRISAREALTQFEKTCLEE